MLSRYQTEVLERLYRQAVKLSVNPVGETAPCECRCDNLGRDAHHVVYRSQETSLRLKFEPRFGLWLCTQCHLDAHASPTLFTVGLLLELRRTNPTKARCLKLYLERHDRIKPPGVSWKWMVAYLKRCIAGSGRRWADTYNQDLIYQE